MFLHPSGDFVSVRIMVRPEARALGAEDAPRDWTGALAETEAEALEAGEIVERVTLAGFAAVNRTRPAGESALARPIGLGPDALNAVRLAVPLSHRIVLHLDGVARARRLEDLILSLDVAAMRAALD
jgi:hypothetical protein